MSRARLLYMLNDCFRIVILSKPFHSWSKVDEILKCDHSSESYWPVLSCGTVYHTVSLVLTFFSL